MRIRAVVGERELPLAVLLEVLATARARAAGVDHAADRGEVADLEALHLVADGRHAADDLVPGHDRVHGGEAGPLVAGHVQIRVAHAAVEDLDPHVALADVAASELERGERRRRGVGRVADGLHEGGGHRVLLS